MSKIKNYCISAPIATSYFVSHFNSVKTLLIASSVVLLIVTISLFICLRNKTKRYGFLKWVLLVILSINLLFLCAYQLGYSSKYEDWQLRSLRNQNIDKSSYPLRDCG
ncbi:MAG: hypothetical protein WCP03_03750 [Candidatus Saccharibacteria bacterium]